MHFAKAVDTVLGKVHSMTLRGPKSHSAVVVIDAILLSQDYLRIKAVFSSKWDLNAIDFEIRPQPLSATSSQGVYEPKSSN